MIGGAASYLALLTSPQKGGMKELITQSLKDDLKSIMSTSSLTGILSTSWSIGWKIELMTQEFFTQVGKVVCE